MLNRELFIKINGLNKKIKEKRSYTFKTGTTKYLSHDLFGLP